MGKTAVIYVRTSGLNQTFEVDSDLKKLEREDKTGKRSLQHQEAECRALAERNEYEVVGLYSDNNFSCVTYPSTTYFRGRAEGDREYLSVVSKIKKITCHNRYRPGFGAMLEHVARGGVDVILVREETRLFRPVNLSSLLGDVLALVKESGTVIHTAQGSIIDPASFSHVFQLQIISMAEVHGMFLKLKASRDSISKKQDAGEIAHGSGGYGFIAKKRKIIPVPGQLAVVRQMYDWFFSGIGVNEICRKLNQSGIKTKQGKVWIRSTVEQVLDRPFYCGYQRGTELVRGKEQQRRTKLPAGMERQLVPVKCLDGVPLPVTLSEWRRAQSMLTDKKPGSRNTDKHHPLSGLVYCGVCGGRMRIQYGFAGRNSYRCQADADRICHEGKHMQCKNAIQVYRRPGELRAGCGLLYSIYPLTAWRLVERWRHTPADAREKIAELETKISTIESVQQGLLDRVLSGKMQQSDFDRLMDDKLVELAAARNALAALRASGSDDGEDDDLKALLLAEAVGRDMKVVSLDLHDIAEDRIAETDMALARRVISAVVERVDIAETEVVVKMRGIKTSLTIPRMVVAGYQGGSGSYTPAASVIIDEEARTADITYQYEERGERVKVWQSGGMSVWFQGRPGTPHFGSRHPWNSGKVKA